jgi:hypothetical protein
MNFFGCMSSKTVPVEQAETEVLPENCVAAFNCHLSLESGRPWVCDVTFFPHGGIALLDKWNDKLKILDQKYSCKSSFSMKDAVALSSVSNDVIAIMASNTILLYSVKGKSISDITVRETRFSGEGLAMTCKDNHVVFLYENRDVYSSVYVKIMKVSNGGLECHTTVEIDMNVNLSGYIAISDKMKRIFLGNIEKKSVMCFSTAGSLLWETKVSSWPRGMVFVDNKILVATFFDHKIHCLSIQGEHLGILFDSSSGIRYPLALCFHKPTQHLLVQCDHFGDFKVFEISSLESLIKVEN